MNAKFFMPYRTIIIQGVEYKGNTCYKIYDNIFNDVMELVKNNGATLLERCIFSKVEQTVSNMDTKENLEEKPVYLKKRGRKVNL